MSDLDTLSKRIETLEIEKTHQDRAIEDLNEALNAQWKEIELLKRELTRLREEVRDSAPGEGGPPDPPPPHY